MSNIKFCSECRKKNHKDLFYSGYYDWLQDDCYECPMKGCGHKLADINLSKEDFNVITSVSKDVNFLESMISLKERDIIEYTLKMNQFKQQVDNNKTKCPRCGSTNIQVLRRMYGEYASFEVDRVCVNCKYQF